MTEPLIYYHFNSKHELFTLNLQIAFNEYFARLDKLPPKTAPELQKFINLINLHFTIVDEMPERARLIMTTCPAKLDDPNGICRKKYSQARKSLSDYIQGRLTSGINRGEFSKLAIPETTYYAFSNDKWAYSPTGFKID